MSAAAPNFTDPGLQIADVGTLDGSLLKLVARELARTVIPWTINYADYQSNGWLTASLMNGSKRTDDTTIRDGKAQPTELLLQLPATRRLLDSLSLDIFWARIARLEPNSFLWEHVDYTEFEDKNRLRLHIPVSTNEGAEIVFADFAVHMTQGVLWMLNPKDIHGAVNRGHTSRLHLILDCRVNDRLSSLLQECRPIERAAFRALPTPNESVIAGRIQMAGCLILAGFRREGERQILNLFHDYHLPAGKTLELVSDIYRRLGMPDLASIWTQRKVQFLGGVRN